MMCPECGTTLLNNPQFCEHDGPRTAFLANGGDLYVVCLLCGTAARGKWI